MKTKMTSRERILATCAGDWVDHVPLSLEVHPSYLQYDKEVANWKDQFERTDALLALGADPMVEIWLPDPSLHPEVKVRSWREPAGPDGFCLLGKEYTTPAGTLRQVIKETDDLYDWHKINRNTCGPLADLIDGVGLLEDVNPSRYIEPLIRGPEDLPKLRYLFQPLSGAALEKWRCDAFYAKKQAEKRQTILLARRLHLGSNILWLTKAEDTMCTFETDPEYVGELLRIVQEWQMRTLSMVLDVGVDVVTRFGYYDGPSFWGRKYFNRYLRPAMDQDADVVHQAGALLSQQQSEGLTILADIYKEMKVDILRDVDPVQGREDMAFLKKQLGSTKTLMGGVNCDVWLANASQREVDKNIRETLDLMAPGGRFILHPIPGIYKDVPWEKVMWMVEAWKKYA